MRIIRKRQRLERTRYLRVFERPDGSGFSFDCDQDGRLFTTEPAALDNYQKCLDGRRNVKDKGILRLNNVYWENAIGECVNCGKEVELRGFTNTCECGADYNDSGQLLAPREQWGEETGESLSDILSADWRLDW